VAEAPAAIFSVEFADLVPHHVHHSLDDELRNAVTALHSIRISLISVQQNHLDLTPIGTVDETRAVDDGDPMFERESTAWQDESRMSDGESKSNPRGNKSPTSGCGYNRIFTCKKIEARIAWMRIGRERKIGIESDHADLEITSSHDSTLVRG
jgi:hypothetical protein